MGGRDTTHLEHCQREMEGFRVHFCPFLGCDGVPYSPRWMVWWSKTQRRGVDFIEILHTRYYYGRDRAGNLTRRWMVALSKPAHASIQQISNATKF